MKRAIASLTLAAMLAGCSHVVPPDPTSTGDVLDEVNGAVNGRTVDITLQNTAELWAKNVRVTADSIWFAVVGQPSYSLRLRDDRGRGLPTSEIQTISVRQHGRGALEGAMYGLLIGALAGAVLGAATRMTPEIKTASRSEGAVNGAVVFGALGLAVGFAWGALVGSKDVYDLTELPREPSQQGSRR
jgi:hypothetical protein